jgi:hypothetical protein
MGKVVMYSTVSVDGLHRGREHQPGPLFDWLSSGDGDPAAEGVALRPTTTHTHGRTGIRSE